MGGRTLSGMGVIRKLTSVVTVGAVDFRSDKERTALYTRQTRNAIERQAQQQTPQRPRGQKSPRAQIRESRKQMAAAQDRLNRLRSSDPAVRDAAYEEWRRENLKP